MGQNEGYTSSKTSSNKILRFSSGGDGLYRFTCTMDVMWLLLLPLNNISRQRNNYRYSMTMRSTCRVRAALEIFVKNFERLWSKRRSSFAFLRRHKTDEVTQVLYAVLVPFFCHRHPPFQHRLYLLCTFWCYVQFLKPTPASTSLSLAAVAAEVIQLTTHLSCIQHRTTKQDKNSNSPALAMCLIKLNVHNFWTSPSTFNISLFSILLLGNS